MKLSIPGSLEVEHNELMKAISSRGDTGQSAKAVAEVLHPHFLKQEKYTLPPLELFLLFENGKSIEREIQTEAIALSDRLASELSQMAKEHQYIVVALNDLRTDAIAEAKQEYALLADRLMMLARKKRRKGTFFRSHTRWQISKEQK